MQKLVVQGTGQRENHKYLSQQLIFEQLELAQFCERENMNVFNGFQILVFHVTHLRMSSIAASLTPCLACSSMFWHWNLIISFYHRRMTCSSKGAYFCVVFSLVSV